MIRTDDHAKIEEMARYASVPVINGLTDASHPCQIVADLLTIIESGKSLPGLKVAWLGDGNNVLASIIEAAALMHFDVVAACPQGFMPPDSDVARGQGRARIVASPAEAVAGADVVVTDTWISMGKEDEAAARAEVFAPYSLTTPLFEQAKPDAIAMHCLPAYRGKEIDAEVLDGPQSVVWDEAENRRHAQKAIMSFLWEAHA
jgi:ornithine carbamoyltransferase